jgi:hypothetical protein
LKATWCKVTGESLVNATYRALGYGRSKYDAWVR